MRLVHLTSLAFGLNAGLDTGDTLDIATTRESIENGTIFELIEAQIENVDLSLIRHRAEQKELLTAWQSLANAVDARRKFSVQNDGICLLLAYTIELIQSHGWKDNS